MFQSLYSIKSLCSLKEDEEQENMDIQNKIDQILNQMQHIKQTIDETIIITYIKTKNNTNNSINNNISTCNLTNINQTIYTYLPNDKTLSWKEFSEIKNICKLLESHHIKSQFLLKNSIIINKSSTMSIMEKLTRCEKHHTILVHIEMHINKCIEKFNIFWDNIYDNNHFQHPKSPFIEDTPNGFDWLLDLLHLFKKYDGKCPTTPYNLMVHFRKNWFKVLDRDTVIICDIIEQRFGNSSLTNIIANFNSWIYANITNQFVDIECD